MYELTVRIISAGLGLVALVVLAVILDWRGGANLTTLALATAWFGLLWSFLDGVIDLRRERRRRRNIAQGNDLALIQAREILLGLENSDTTAHPLVVRRYLKAFAAELREEIKLREKHQYTARQRAAQR